jgi:hypothetical protein
MKRTLGLFLVVIALTFGLSACGADENIGNQGADQIVALLPSGDQDLPEQTLPIETPSPEEPIQVTEEEQEIPFCTISIDCLVAITNIEDLEKAKVDILPADGMILSATEVEFQAGDTVFDVLVEVTRENKIHMEFSENPVLKSTYIEGIANIYEFDCGERSGWTYLVNGKGVGVGSSSYVLSDGDVIQWRYTCDGGDDVGVRAN